ncbi:OmpA family protein [bacterium]|nr:OmpA family protein [bacterium]
MKLLTLILFTSVLITGCTTYTSPPRGTWSTYLRGAGMADMTPDGRIARRPIFLGAGGRVVSDAIDTPPNVDYGDKVANDNAIALQYMTQLEYAMYDALRKPGISVQRAGTDVVVILVRDAIMQLDVGEISDDGADTLKTIAKILNKYDATFIEIAGYTDAMRDTNAANTLSQDMAMRSAVFLSQAKVNPVRMFIVGRGAARPIAAQDDIGRLTNRRIELRIAPAR